MSFYCKNCGTELENVDGQKTAVCDFCGMEQTLPTADDPQKLELFAKANDYRIASRFDLAKKQYESIIAQYPDDNEAYWCKLLCVYGIEYVEDSLTEKKLPTCHRTVTESIFDNSEYKLIMSRATAEEKAIYEAEAKEIDRIQKEILAKADKEEPYDIFICYKETEIDGKKRTLDAQHATKIYTYLTEHGYKVFFSRITLKGKLGSEYEPVIYSALKSAKVMLHVTTSAEHTNAPWVRNEWSRFLEFMNADVTKTILPCIAQMGPYELPDELSKFQVAYVTDLDFHENLLLQINKKFGRYVEVKKAEPVTVTPIRSEQSPTQTTNNATIQPLLKRINIFLINSEWEKADEYAEKVLDIEPECGDAYLAKIFAKLRVKSLDEVSDSFDWETDKDYKTAKLYADASLGAKLATFEKKCYYIKALPLFNSDLTVDKNYKKAKELLTKADDYKDAKQLLESLSTRRQEQLDAKILAEKKRNYELALTLISSDLTNDETYEEAKQYLKKADDYKDAKQLLETLPQRKQEQINAKILAEKKRKYELAIPLLKTDLTVDENYKKAVDLLKKADDYKDAKQLLENLPKLRAEQEKAKYYKCALLLLKTDLTDEENYKKAEDLLAKADDYKDAKQLLKKIIAEREGFLRQQRRKKKQTRLFVILSAVLAIIIATVITIICVTDYNARDGLKMQLQGDYYVVTGIDGNAKSSYKIPSTYQGKPVKEIGSSAFSSCDNLTSIEIPDSVTSIGELAFWWCTSLTSIEIPDSVTSIGNGAFWCCDSLTSIEIPASVTSIESSAFSSCDSLTSIEIPDSVTSIGMSVFDSCSKLTSITFGENSKLTSIGSDVFSNCISLTSIEIPDSVTSIGGSAFDSCSKLTSITFGENSKLTSIGYRAFGDCSSLTSIEIPDSVTSIGIYTFYDCTSLASIEIPDSVTSIGSSVFYNCSSLTSIEIPNSVTSIGYRAFSGCDSLTSIEIPDSVTSIEESAFSHCKSLTSIKIPKSVTSIGGYAFSTCSKLTIYCEVAREPSGWDSKWNSSYRPVVWDYKNK
ncbi:MAG: leucine-rich repeat protein [Clostridia bacterium]|nr:leucine-rich repeat protein [Clostridia bacterium]